MVKNIRMLRYAALGAPILGSALGGLSVNVAAQQAKGDGGNSSLRGKSPDVGADGRATGEGALSTGNCYVGMPIYTKEDTFVGRGVVNTCN